MCMANVGRGVVVRVAHRACLYEQLPRNNFDSLLWSAVTVFQVITGENWNNIMYDTMRGNGMAACVYFISLVRSSPPEPFAHRLTCNTRSV
jgi:hypothetical protein